MRVELTNHHLVHKSSFGTQYINVECIAKVSGEGLPVNGDDEKYKVIYHRDPISGDARSIIIEGPVEGSKTTVSLEDVKDMVENYLTS